PLEREGAQATALRMELRGRESWPFSIRRRRRSVQRPAARHGPLREFRHASLGTHPEASGRRADSIVQASLQLSLDNSSSQAPYGQDCLWPKPARGTSYGSRLEGHLGVGVGGAPLVGPPPTLVVTESGRGIARGIVPTGPRGRASGPPTP